MEGSPQEGPRSLDPSHGGASSEYDGPVLCATCMSDCRYATQHCQMCGRCVCGLDVHVPHLGVCAGQGNRRMFVYTLLVSAFTFLLHWCFAYSYVFCSIRLSFPPFSFSITAACILWQDMTSNHHHHLSLDQSIFDYAYSLTHIAGTTMRSCALMLAGGSPSTGSRWNTACF